MAFPVVSSLTPTAFDTDATAHLVAMPATVNSGDLLIVGFSNDGLATVSTPGTWNLLHSTLEGGNAVRLSCYYKIAAGTEGGTTVDFVTSGTEKAAAHVYWITSWHGTTPPEVGTAANGSGTAPNPPTLSPSWGAEDTLWLAVEGNDAAVTLSGYPTSYTNGTNTSSAAPNGNGIGSARRELNATSDDPAAFTLSATEQWVAQTIAIRPSAGGSTQNLTGSLFTKAPTFFTGVVTSVRNLAGALFTKAPTFFTGTVTATRNLSGTLFTKAPTFFTGAVTATRTITGVLFTKAPTFFTGTVTPGVRTLTGTLFTKAPTFPTGAVSLASSPQTLTGSLFTKAPTFPQGAVTATYSLTGTLFVKAPTFFTGTVSSGAVTLTGVLFVKAPTFPQGAITTGVVSLTGVLFQKAPTFFIGTVTAGTITLGGVLFQKAPTFPQGTIGQAGTLFGTLFVKAPTFFTGSIAQGAPSFWQTNPAGYTRNPVGYVKIGAGDTPPWN